MKRFGIDKFIQTLEYDENSVKLIDDWLNKKKADVRKEYLKVLSSQASFGDYGIYRSG